MQNLYFVNGQITRSKTQGSRKCGVFVILTNCFLGVKAEEDDEVEEVDDSTIDSGETVDSGECFLETSWNDEQRSHPTRTYVFFRDWISPWRDTWLSLISSAGSSTVSCASCSELTLVKTDGGEESVSDNRFYYKGVGSGGPDVPSCVSPTVVECEAEGEQQPICQTYTLTYT